MGIITASTSTQFPVGSKVKITDDGQACTTYKAMKKYMKKYMKLDNCEVSGYNVFKGTNVVGVVVAKAMHEAGYGEMLAVQVGERVGLILSKGVVEYEEPVVIGKPKLSAYDHAPLTPHATERLSKYFKDAPEWATHVGSDDTGIHFFDHHPHIYKSRIEIRATFLKGMLPPSHKSECHVRGTGRSDTLEVVVIVHQPKAPTAEEQLEAVKVELATTKAKLWDAENKLSKIKALV